jgi:carbon-monoxide dehydrogenase small subunit
LPPALLDHHDPSEKDIRETICRTLCHCTGYENIVRSARCAAVNQEVAA